MKNPSTFWTPIWSQALAKAMFNGQTYNNKTSCFQFKTYVKGKSVRLRFSNVSGKENIVLGSVTVWNQHVMHELTLNQRTSIVIPKGECLYSDVIKIPIEKEDVIEVRMHFKSALFDLNHTEKDAQLYPGDQTKTVDIASKPLRSIVGEMMGIYPVVPVIDRIEIETIHEPKIIMAFGDSITAMNQWVKPLRERIHQRFEDEFVLMNAGISGNCLLHEIMRPLGNLFGRKGVDRFKSDVLNTEHLHTVIFALGINDVSYYRGKMKSVINLENYRKALMEIADDVHKRNAHIIVCTLTPRIGFKLIKFTDEMEALRMQINDWIRSCDTFDAIFDMDEVIRDPNHLNVVDDRYHIGDHLHPNSLGGQKIADAFDIDQLVGFESKL